MPEELIQLQPKQTQLLDLLEATGTNVPTIIGWGGARGSSKSGGLRRVAIALAQTHPAIVVYIVRRVLGDLLENHMEKIKLEFPFVHRLYRPSDYEYQFDNKSRIVFVYAESKADVDRVSYGPECTFLLIDQAEQFTEDELISFRICNRWPAMPAGFAKSGYFFNAGKGVSAGYLRRIFHQRNFYNNETPSDYHFTQAYGWDNYEWFKAEVPISYGDFYDLSSAERFEIFITQTSEGRKMNSLPAARREAELLGNFDAFTGQYFSDVWGEHCILTVELVNRIVKPWWTRWMAQDWAFAEHDCHLWFVTGRLKPSEWADIFGGSCEWPMDVVIIYRELVTINRAEADLANDIADNTPQWERPLIREFYLSQDAFGQKARQQGDNTVGQQFASIMHRHGLPEPRTADQNRITGWRFMYNCIRQAALRGANIDSERAKQGPALFVSVECPQVIDNIPQAVRDEKNPEDIARIAGALWEDVTDAVRYGLKSKLDPKQTAPVAVRASELSQSIEDPTNRALAMLHFREAEKQRGMVRRAPRWR